MKFLFSNKISENWSEVLSGGPYIIGNSVHKEINEIIKKFPTSPFRNELSDYVSLEVTAEEKHNIRHQSLHPPKTYDHSGEYYDAPSENKVMESSLQKWLGKNTGIIGAQESNYIEDNYYLHYLDKKRIQLACSFILDDEGSGWGAMAHDKNGLYDYPDLFDDSQMEENHKEKNSLPSIDEIMFWRFLRPKDLYLLEISEGVETAFYKYISRNGLPPDFIYSEIAYQGAGCSPACGFELRVMPRWMRFRILVLENISKKQLDIGQFTLREKQSYELRSEEEDKQAQSLIPYRKQKLLSQKYLMPGEKIAIPLEINFSYDEGDIMSIVPSGLRLRGTKRLINNVHKISETRFLLKAPDDTYGMCAGDSYSLEVSKYRLLESLAIPPIKNNDAVLKKVFIYGPTVFVRDVEVNGRVYPIRAFDPASLVIVNGYRHGSCPHVYTFNNSIRDWGLESPVLVGADASFKERLDGIKLKSFDGRVRLVEDESETSYINQVYLKVISQDGKEAIVPPSDRRLRAADRSYVTLNRGDIVEISFDLSSIKQSKEYLLYVRGFYKPRREPVAAN